MKISFNNSTNFINSNFKSNYSITAQRIISQFERDALHIKDKRRNVVAEKEVIKRLLKGLNIGLLSKSFGVPISRIKKLSADYDVLEAYRRMRDDKILERLLNNENRNKIANDMNIHLRTVQVVADKYKTYNEVKSNQYATRIEKIQSGMKYKDVADELGLHVATVKRTAKRFGIQKTKK